CDGAVAGLLDDAAALAEPVLRADPAAYLREGVGEARQLPGLAHPALGSRLQPVGDVVVQRTVRLAERHAALAAPRSLGAGFRVGIVAVDLAEILPPLPGRTLLGHGTADFDELQHSLRHLRRPLAGTRTGTSFRLRYRARNEKTGSANQVRLLV